MNANNYYARHPWNSLKFYAAPAARRVMDYLLENTTNYPRCVDGHFLPPGRILTTRRRVCDDLGISLRDLVTALNTLDLHRLISRFSYNPDTLHITIILSPDETTTPPAEANEVEAQSIAPATPERTQPESKPTPDTPQSIARAYPPNGITKFCPRVELQQHPHTPIRGAPP